MTDKQSVKAFEDMRLIDANLLWKEFDTAHLFDNGNPRHIAQQTVEEQPTVDVLGLIKRQQAENEKLQIELDLAKAFQKEKESEFSLLKYKYNKILSQLDSYQDIVKLATIKEYREKAAIKLAENARSDYWHWIDDTLYEVEKEMVGED